MGYDRAQECRRSTEVNGRGFRNTDIDHYTTARFKGMKEEGKGDSRGLPEVKAEDGSQVRRLEYSDVGGSVKTTEDDGKPNNVNNQSKRRPERSGEDRNVKPEEDGGERMITGSHPVVVRMLSGIEPEVNRHRPGVDWELTGRWPEVIGITRMIGKFRRSGGGTATEIVKGGGRIAAVEKGVRAGGQKTSGKRRAKLEAPNLCRTNTEGMNEGGREPEVQRKSQKKAKVKVRKRKRMKKFRNPNAGGCEMEPKSFGDSPKVTITDERTSSIVRPEVVGEIVAKLFRSQNLLHVCSTVEPERTEVTERRFGGRNFLVGIWHKRKP
ncbi:hypothetical protein K438DRAFT_1934785 [Mycena galopus ATCC 62051]|nr:hypothetical protein K438DRAFT_1934785 [Mycena galopus ATCC 62051]